MNSYLEKYRVPRGWKLVSFDDIIIFLTDYQSNGSFADLRENVKTYQEENYAVLVRLKDLRNQLTERASFIYTDKHGYEYLGKSKLNAGDIVVANVGSIGVTLEIPSHHFRATLAPNMFRVDITKYVNKNLFVKYCQGELFKNQLIKVAGGSTSQPKINKSQYREIILPLPPLSEQEKINQKLENLLNTIEKGEEHLKNAQYQLKLYRESILQKAFIGQLTDQWREDNNPEMAESLFRKIKNNRKAFYEKKIKDWKNSRKLWEKNGKEGERPIKPKQNRIIPPTIESDLEKLPTIPSSWRYTKLGFLGDLQRGKSKHRPRNDSRLFGGKYPFIQTSEIRNAKVIIHKFDQTYSDFGLQQSKLWKEGTLCITIAANIAETAFLGFDACFPDSVVGFTPEPGVSDKYIFYFIQFSKKQIEKFAPATAQKNINLSILDNVFIPFCSINEQNAIVEYLEKAYSSIEELENNILDSLKEAGILRQGILKSAFEGKLVLQDPNDEPASELLRKIQKEKQKWQESQKEKKKISKPKKRMEALTIEQVLKKAEEPISPKELWETSKHKHDIEEFYLELKKLGDKVVEIKSETESLLRLEDAN